MTHLNLSWLYLYVYSCILYSTMWIPCFADCPKCQLWNCGSQALASKTLKALTFLVHIIPWFQNISLYAWLMNSLCCLQVNPYNHNVGPAGIFAFDISCTVILGFQVSISLSFFSIQVFKFMFLYADCSAVCLNKCVGDSKKRSCVYLCKKCCKRCPCAPLATFHNKNQLCPCYALTNTHDGRNICP